MGKGTDPNCEQGMAMEVEQPCFRFRSVKSSVQTLSQGDLRDHVSLDYDFSTNCSAAGCTGVCRCGRICDLKLGELDIEDLVKRYADENEREGEMDLYGTERILRRQRITSDDFEVSICNGYYGQEIDRVLLDPAKAKQADREVGQFFSLVGDTTQQTQWLLVREYGYLLPQLQDLRFEIQEVPTSRLHFGAETHYHKLDSQQVKEYQRPSGLTIPRGVVVEADGRFRVVDGYHRLSADKSSGHKKLRVLVGSAT